MSSNQTNTAPTGHNNNNNNNNPQVPNMDLDTDNGQAAPQPGAPTQRQQHEQQQQEQIPQGLQGSQFNTYQPPGGNARGGTFNRGRGTFRGRGGRGQGRGGHTGRGGHQNQGTAPNNPDDQILGKRSRGVEVDASGREMMPFFKQGEYTFNRNQGGAITGLTPTDPRADASNMVARNPFGDGLLFQSEPLTQRGSNMMSRLLEGAALGSSTGRVIGTLAAAEDIGISNNLDRIGVSSIGQRAEILPIQRLMNRNQNQNQGQNQGQNQNQGLIQARPQNQNQVQGPAQPVQCVLCSSRVHRTGQCPIPSSYHHGDTAVCSIHNSTNKHPQHGHIFDMSATKSNLTCRDVTHAQNGIFRRQNRKEHFESLIKWLVLERQHKAPLRVEDPTLDFVEVVIDYAREFCNGEMPQPVNFIWPYTKAEARLYNGQLRRYDELGPQQMPRGMLDGKSLTEIKAMRDRGEIPLQVYKPHDQPAANPEPARPATNPEPFQTATGANQEPVAGNRPQQNEAAQAQEQPAPAPTTASAATGAGDGTPSNNPTAAELLQEAQATSATGDMELDDLSVDVGWADVPDQLKPYFEEMLNSTVCNPEALELLKGLKEGWPPSMIVTKEEFKQRLHRLATDKKLPHQTIKVIREHWPLEKKKES